MNNNTLRRERKFKSLKRLSVIVSIIFIIATTMLIIPNNNLISTSSGTTFYVGGTGFGNYSSIQDAINTSKNGDTVYVYSKTYYENIVVNRSIHLIGEDRDTTIIDGSKGGKVVQITSDLVYLSGFTIYSLGNVVGLNIFSDYNTISGNNVSNNGYVGIYLQNSRGNNISDNAMLENGIYIIGDQLDHWNTHDIDASNTVNGKPVYYWKNQNVGTIPPGAGQVILANCTNVNVENQMITNGSIGIVLGFSSFNNLARNRVSACKYWYGIGLYFSSGNNITGNDVNGNNYDGLYLSYSSENNILDNRISNNENGNGIRLENSGGNYITDNIVSSHHWFRGIWLDHSNGNYIIGNNVSNNFIGIHLLYSSNNTIEDNTCNLNTWDGIDLQDNCDGNAIENNTLYSSGMRGIVIWTSDENSIIGNSISSTNNHHGIWVYGSCRNNVVGNIAFSNADNGIFLDYADGNKVTGNYVSSNDEYGIRLYYSIGNDIAHNNISSNRYGGVKLEHSIWNNLFDNNISNNEQGVQLIDASNNNVVTDNQILSNKYDGILLESSLDNKITDNNISDNLEGVNVTSSSDNNIISGNYVSNKGYGIRVSSSSSNTFTGNNVSSNSLDGLRLLSSSNRNSIIGNTVFSNGNYGFYINGSSDNSIYHNNILDNIIQAYDDTNNGNQWDNGYPSGGNYWSDFDEPSEGAYDDYNGPDQNVLSGDGIVDKGFGGGGGKNPYVIDSDSQDNYPLMGPYKNYMILKQGWNLISIPQIQQEQNLTKVLASIDGLYDAVQWYDITDKNDPWKHYRPGKPYGNDLFKIKETMGFWIHIIPPGDTIFYYNGVKPAQTQKITLYPGWNMVGYPSLSNKLRTTALNNINFGSDVDSIWTHDAATQKWEEIGEFDYFEVGRGYWIHSMRTTDVVWDVPL